MQDLDVIAAFCVGLADVASVGRKPGPLGKRKVQGINKDTNGFLPYGRLEGGGLRVRRPDG